MNLLKIIMVLFKVRGENPIEGINHWVGNNVVASPYILIIWSLGILGLA